MKFNFLKSIGGPTVQRAFLKASKYAPEILTGVGIAGVIGSTILIAKATTKLEPIIERHEKEVEVLRTDKALIGADNGRPMYDGKEIQKELVKTYAHTSLNLIKIYGPGVSLSVASLISILAAHGIMKRRTVVLLGAYKAVESAFGAYRQRVIEEFGDEKDRDFRLGFHTEKIEDKETGKKKTVRSIDPNHISQYAKWFDEGNVNWEKDAEYNLLFLKNHQNWANDRLRVQGFLFLCDVYDMLGFDRTQESMLVGWVMDPKNGGDLHVDFNIYTADSIAARAFVNGLERSIMLDFNVDGVILDLI